MSSILLNNDEQGIVVFHVLKSLKYKTRLILCLLLILSGLALQYFTMEHYNQARYLLYGLCLVFAGNMLMLVKGYTNKINLAGYSAESEWVKTSEERLKEILEINKKAKKWDINSLDISNVAGAFVFIGFVIALIILSVSGIFESGTARTMLFLNAALLFLPHWLTGIRRVMLTPNLLKKVKIYLHVLETFRAQLENHEVQILAYVKGSDQKMPRDLKMKIDFKDQPDDFLGMYVQISMNNVQEVLYPYFYVVLVAKQNTLMDKKFQHSIKLAPKIVSELKSENEADILVLRQRTSKSGGYFTKGAAVSNIFNVGLINAEILLH